MDMNIPPKLFKSFQLSCRTECTVLINGSTGTGKSTLAYEIHRRGERKTKPFVTINLASIHEGTLESELFGHERGSFTGAERKRIGRFQEAQGGSIFLDEIGELPLRLQARLLEFLQLKKIRPIGSNQEIKLDVRILAATHRNLHQLVRNKFFREDLFYRLRVITLLLPPLKDRIHELDFFVEKILAELGPGVGKRGIKLALPVVNAFKQYQWPGNFRELGNVLEYALLSVQGQEIQISDLPEWFLEEIEEK